MHKIIKNRIKLIRAMICSNDDLRSYYHDYYSYDNILGFISSIRSNKESLLSTTNDFEEMRISFSKNEENKFSYSKRTKSTLGRYIMRNNKLLNDTDLNIFISLVWAQLNAKTLPVAKVNGNEIIETYRKIDESSHSCMTGYECYKTELYARNPEKVSLVLYNEIRALLWECDDGSKVLDRAYPSGHYKVMVLRAWAKERNYVLRVVADRNVTDYVIGLSDDSIKTVTMNLENNNRGKFPFLDTFRFGKFVDGKLILKNCVEDQDVIFRRADGKFDNVYNQCSSCERVYNVMYMHQDSCNTRLYYCNNCF